MTQGVIHLLNEYVGVFSRKRQRWPDLDYIATDTATRDENPPLSQLIDKAPRLFGVVVPGVAIVDDLAADKQASATNVTDDRMRCREMLQAMAQIFTNVV